MILADGLREIISDAQTEGQSFKMLSQIVTERRFRWSGITITMALIMFSVMQYSKTVMMVSIAMVFSMIIPRAEVQRN
jgi:hypothetical protein